MAKKYTATTIILLIILFIDMHLNGFLLLFLLLFDMFYLIDLITLASFILSFLSVIGIINLKKWGSYIAIIDGIYGIGVRLIFFLAYNIIGLIFGIILNSIIILFAYKEIRHLDHYEPYIPPKPVVYQKLYPPVQRVETNSINVRYCGNCGTKLEGNFCHKCGTKI